ncbi:hypothetical protein FSST1_011263 [Fusarium sambucinum]
MIEHYSFAHMLGPALFLTGLFIFWAHKHFQPTLPLPPGPPSEFLLGHTRIIPKENAAKVYSRWSKEYSEFAFQKVVNRPPLDGTEYFGPLTGWDGQRR